MKFLPHAMMSLSAFALSACATTPANLPTAQAQLKPTAGNATTGLLTVVQHAEHLSVSLHAQGVPAGLHGFHVHEHGDCSSADGSSAGGHFNPTKEEHGGPHAMHHHVGDFGNVMADANGNVDFTIDIPLSQLTLDPAAPNALAGRSVILHAIADDLQTQPTGNSGARLACGVVSLQK
jgi:superoxide dismutase, Cu-Zn family